MATNNLIKRVEKLEESHMRAELNYIKSFAEFHKLLMSDGVLFPCVLNGFTYHTSKDFADHVSKRNKGLVVKE
jgi:hypothetical protein